MGHPISTLFHGMASLSKHALILQTDKQGVKLIMGLPWLQHHSTEMFLKFLKASPAMQKFNTLIYVSLEEIYKKVSLENRI